MVSYLNKVLKEFNFKSNKLNHAIHQLADRKKNIFSLNKARLKVKMISQISSIIIQRFNIWYLYLSRNYLKIFCTIVEMIGGNLSCSGSLMIMLRMSMEQASSWISGNHVSKLVHVYHSFFFFFYVYWFWLDTV